MGNQGTFFSRVFGVMAAVCLSVVVTSQAKAEGVEVRFNCGFTFRTPASGRAVNTRQETGKIATRTPIGTPEFAAATVLFVPELVDGHPLLAYLIFRGRLQEGEQSEQAARRIQICHSGIYIADGNSGEVLYSSFGQFSSARYCEDLSILEGAPMQLGPIQTTLAGHALLTVQCDLSVHTQN